MASDPLPAPLRWLLRVGRPLLPQEIRDEIEADLGDVYRRARARGEGAVRSGLRITWYVLSTNYVGLHRSARRLRVGRARPEARTHAEPDRTAGVGLVPALRQATRSLRRSAGFTALAVGTIGIGVGSVAAVSGVVSAVLIRPLPFRQAEELVLPWQVEPGLADRINASEPQLRAWRTEVASFAEVAGYRGPGWTMVTDGPQPERVPSVRVTPDFFEVLGVTPASGRTFTANEGRPGSARVAVVSQELLQRLGLGERGPGSTVSLDEEPHTIVGVMPAGFSFVERGIDVWYPWEPGVEETWDQWTVKVVARLAPGATATSAARELSERHAALRSARPGLDVPSGVTVRPLLDELVGGVRDGLLATWAAVALGLLIAMVNVGGLLLARNVARRPEFAMMRALGASRPAILAHVAAQSLTLSVTGLAVGWGVARALVWTIVRLLPPDFPRVDDLALDGPVLGTAIAASMLVALGAGALSVPWNDETLGADARSGGGRRRSLDAILVAQTALAVVLLVAGGLVVRSFAGLATTDPGIEPRGAMALELRLPSSVAGSDEAVRQFVAAVDEGVAALPGVEATGQVQRLPFAGGNWSSFVLDPERPDLESPPDTDVRVVTPGYLDAVGLPLLRGRGFGVGDASDGPRSVLVNELLASRLWPGQDPVGRRLVVDMFGSWDAEVVGVVGPVRHHGLADVPRPEVYVPYAQMPVAFSTLVVRGAVDAGVVSAVRRIVRDLQPGATVSRATTMTALVDRSIAVPRMHAFVFGGLGALALFLSAVGIFGVTSFKVSRSTREIGLRAALGASSWALRGGVLLETGRLLAVGTTLGLVAAFALLRGLSSLLYGVDPGDPATYAVVAATLGTLGLLATLAPARRAARVDPMVAMRETT